MEDKRITKTKKNIKDTLVRMLHDVTFEKITVAELCREGMLSRITFYTYYDSKYDLLREMFDDFIAEVGEDYRKIQSRNNPEGDVFKGYENLLESILNLFFNHVKFFRHTSPTENPYLFSEFYSHLIVCVDDYLSRNQSAPSKYTSRQKAVLICSGLFGLITDCVVKRMKEDEIRKVTRSMFKDLMQSSLLGR